MTEHMRRLIAGAVAEVDRRQIEMSRHLTPAQRFRQALSMIELAEGVGAYRLRQCRPDLSEAEALRIIRSRNLDA
ncbi:MAG: hypothetical protein KIS63_01815 [Caldilineales bacterium]|nr:hypothetical protein [Caldilineales bacterium]